MTEVPEDQTRGLEKGAKEMEEGLERLGSDIETAHERADEQRERANPEAAAGDWEDESAGAYQGADAVEAGDTDTRTDDDPGAAVADAPVHDATEVQPGAEEADEGGGAGADAPVHEAEQVEPEGEG